MNKELKKYLSQKFEGRNSFLNHIVFPIFGKENFDDAYDVEALDSEDLQDMAHRTGIKSVVLYGTVQIDTLVIEIFDVTVSDRVMMRRNRVTIQQLIRRIMDTYTSAFIVFHYENSDSGDWRFSFCQKESKEVTEAKRYTFLLGPGQSCRTAADNFQKLIDKHGKVNQKDIIEAFDVEALSKEFFDKYKAKYEKFCKFVYDNRHDESLFGHEFAVWDEKLIRDYVKKLLGRIVFLHFLQKKGWMGVPADEEWGKGDPQFMKHLFEASSQKQKDNYLDCVLEPLFAGALNTQRPNDVFDHQVDGFRTTRIPYLNGGLFELDLLDEPKSTFPAEYFADLFEFFYQYNFTIDENDPNDAEVGIDPEMLGRIFENLLEDNKDKGAFYTPKEIVQYMCRESLIAYLTTCVMKKQGENHKPEEKIKESVRQLLNKPEEIVPRMTQEHLDDFGSYIRNVKICDPAIGSGAFPMGLLNELVRCRTFIGAWAKDDQGNLLEGDYAALKTEIISNNIYGVDIEKGAIDIARLRFWLSIIVDEHTPHALPNFDYKFMQGNSLISTFDGKYINLDTKETKNKLTLKLIAEKKKLYRLKQLHYKASGEAKHVLDVEIKCSILRMIALRLGHESRVWYQNNIVQTSIAFDEDIENSSFNTIRQKLPEEKLKAIEFVEMLYKQLNDKSISLSERSRMDIHFFDWRIMFTEVFDNGADGFDIVIGNPPYIQLQNNGGELAQLYEHSGFSTFARTGDIYCLFYERGWQLLKNEAHLCFITSNKWMRAGYGEKTRAFLVSRTNPKLLIDFAGMNIFESATVDTNVLLFSKSGNQHQTVCAATNKRNIVCCSLNDFVQLQSCVCDFSLSDSWIIMSSSEQNIKCKMEAIGTPLKDWDICVNYGLKTGFNDAFIISTDKRNEILTACKDTDERQRTEELIRPILRGKDIKRYGYVENGLYLINTHNGIRGRISRINIEDYPAIKAHLDQYWEKIKNRSDQGYTPYNLRNCAYLMDFNKPKIVWGNLNLKGSYSYVPEGIFVNAPSPFIATSNVAILHILNSTLADFYIRSLGVTRNGGYFEYKPMFVEKLPIPKYGLEKLNTYPVQPTKDQEHEIDQLVYQLYGLTEEEITIVESKNE